MCLSRCGAAVRVPRAFVEVSFRASRSLEEGLRGLVGMRERVLLSLLSGASDVPTEHRHRRRLDYFGIGSLYIYIYVYTYTYIYIYIHIYYYVYIYISLSLYIYIYIYTFMYICNWSRDRSARVSGLCVAALRACGCEPLGGKSRIVMTIIMLLIR